MKEQHEPEVTKEEQETQGRPQKYSHYAIQVEPNGTIGLYKNGKPVKRIDFYLQNY